MTLRLIGTTRRARLFVGAVVTVITIATVVVGQSVVTGAEDDSTGSAEFTVAGDGSLPTKRPKLGDVRDPLSTDELGYAARIASTDDSVPSGASNVRGEDGPQFLYADLPDGDNDSHGRVALVVLYDYTANTAYHQLVDLASGKVVRSSSARHLQPPTTADEADVAVDIALKAERSPRFVQAFERAEGVPLVSPRQIHYVAGAWSYDGTTTGGKECGAHRCAQLMVSTPAGTYLDTTDFVADLSTNTLVTLERP